MRHRRVKEESFDILDTKKVVLRPLTLELSSLDARGIALDAGIQLWASTHLPHNTSIYASEMDGNEMHD